jgi:predicted Mrr-cat superfamily restriction endonuclease
MEKRELMTPLQVIVVRTKPHGIDREGEFLGEEGPARVSIGWATKISFEGKSRAEIKALLAEEGWQSHALAVTEICNFVEIPEGSIILTPSSRNRKVHVFQTISKYEYISSWYAKGNPHTIRVELITTVDRDLFPPKIRSSLLAAKKAVTNFTKYKNEILHVLDKIRYKDSPENLSYEEYRVEAKNVLLELLNSKNEDIRLRAALALIEKE